MVITSTLNESYFYKNYVEQCRRKNKPYVSQKEFMKTIKAYTNVMAGVLITEGRVIFPGTIFGLDLRREKKSVTDLLAMKSTNGHEPEILNFNEHSFGYSASFGIVDHGIKKANFYSFKKSFKTKKAIVQYLKSDPRNILKYRIIKPREDGNQ